MKFIYNKVYMSGNELLLYIYLVVIISIIAFSLYMTYKEIKNEHNTESIINIEIFNTWLVILKKNIGAVPKNKPIVVSPKAKPGFFFKTLTNIASVIDIVIEKAITPINEIIIILSPKHRNGIASNVLKIATFLIPNTSLNIPPRALPKPIKVNNNTFCITVLFHDVGIPYPI